MSLLSAFLIWVLPITLSFITAYLVYEIYRFNRLNRGWLFVAFGFLLIVLLRVLTWMNDGGIFPDFFVNWYIYDPILRIMNNVCFIFGFWSMLKNFENFDVVGKKIKRMVSRREK